MRRMIWMAIFLLSTSFPLLAENATLTVDQAVALALKNNLDIRQAEQDVFIARADLLAAWADLYMPSLQLAGSFAYTDPVPSAANPYNDSYSAGVTVRKDLFAGGKYWSAKEAKRLALDYAESKYGEKTKEIKRQTRLNFYSLLLLKEKLRIAVDFDKSLKYRLESARINYANGIVSQLDYLKEQVKYKNNQPLLLKARADYRIARINFAAFVGAASNGPGGSLPSSAEGPALSLVEGPEPSGDILDSLRVALKNADEEAVIQAALARDLTLRALDFETAVNAANKDALLAARWPTLTGSFNYKFDYKRDTGPDRIFLPGWTASLSLIVPLDPWIPGVSKLSQQIAGADALAAKKKLQREQTEAAVKGKVKTLIANAALAEESIASQQENVKQAKLVQDTAARQYREGSLSALDLNDAEVAYSQALANYWQALYDRYANVLQLNDYLE
jgi:outer membrane protein